LRLGGLSIRSGGLRHHRPAGRHAVHAQLRLTGTFATGWTLEFDDGLDAGEPDFNDLVITVVATPAP
jgi:hypothetical protein